MGRALVRPALSDGETEKLENSIFWNIEQHQRRMINVINDDQQTLAWVKINQNDKRVTYHDPDRSGLSS